MCRLMPTFSVTHAELPSVGLPEAEVVDGFIAQYQSQGKRDGLRLERTARRTDAGVEVEFSFQFEKTPGRERLFIRLDGRMLWVLRFVYDPGCAASVRPFVEPVARSFAARRPGG